MAVIEALACGLPCLLSDISPHAEIFKLSDSPGSLYTLGDKNAFKMGLRHVLGRDYQSLRKQALQVVAEHLNAKKMSEGYHGVYEGMGRYNSDYFSSTPSRKRLT